MAKDVSIDNLTDEGLVRLWEGVMEQAAKDYIDLYIAYLKNGPDARVNLISMNKHPITAKPALIELEDYIVGDLIAGPHAEYIIHNLRREAMEHVKDGRTRRKEILRR